MEKSSTLQNLQCYATEIGKIQDRAVQIVNDEHPNATVYDHRSICVQHPISKLWEDLRPVVGLECTKVYFVLDGILCATLEPHIGYKGNRDKAKF